MICYIGVGSNLGDRLENIREALVLLEATQGIRIKRLSELYETEPWGGTQRQNDYFNLVIEIESVKPPEELLKKIKEIERKVGRKARKARWASREIDLDILFCNDLVIEKKRLKVPHPLIQERFFVLKPLADLAPDFKHPLLHLDIETMLASLKRPGRWRRIDEEIDPQYRSKKDRWRLRRSR
jgi:2-amino-4-hydroxy-6-hydroxymethyldihydropteridine diphosphokinase